MASSSRYDNSPTMCAHLRVQLPRSKRKILRQKNLEMKTDQKFETKQKFTIKNFGKSLKQKIKLV
jgi:hypothetical protein